MTETLKPKTGKTKRLIFDEEKIGPALRQPDSRGFYSHININSEAGGIGVLGETALANSTSFRPVEEQANLDDWPSS